MAHLPSLFVSHGAPTFAIDPGLAGPRLRALGRLLPRPRAVVVVSPHWMTPRVRVTRAAPPATIHDFSGFDPVLYQLRYPAPGDPELAGRIVDLLRAAGWDAEADAERGLDHGVWVPLSYLYPEADVPVVQISMPAWLDAETAYRLGRALGSLARQDVLVVGSGSLTHNLYELRAGGPEADYAGEFAAWIGEAVRTGDPDRLVHALERAPHARRAHPTAEHFWPLLVAAGASPRYDATTVIEGGLTYGVLSMDAFVFGQRLDTQALDDGERDDARRH